MILSRYHRLVGDTDRLMRAYNFGEAGRHARSAIGVASLPLDAPVEVEVVVAVED